jgi:CDP-diglyceride synthetase
MSASEVHGALANTATLYFIALTIWGYFRFFRKQGVESSLWGALAIAEILLLVQGLLGGYLWIIGARPARDMHMLYGIVSLMAIPAAYMYTKGRTDRPEVLIYATTSLITFGLIMRAVSTAQFTLGG